MGDSLLEQLQARKMIAQVSDAQGLSPQLDEGRVTFYIGIDPTAATLHCGHLVPLYLLIALAQRGNRPLIIIGDGTAQIGDPSGKSEMRPYIDSEEIARNADAIEGQLEVLLSRAGVRAKCVRNGSWLNALSYVSFLRDIGSRFSVNRMLSFESVKRRLKQRQGLSFLEFNYMLLQAYDFLMLYQQYGCTLQIAGDDQWGNIVSGIDLIRRKEQAEAYALTTPLILTANGEKMGKSASGALFIDPQRTSVFDYYQYWRNVDDRDIYDFLLRFTTQAAEDLPTKDATQQELNAAKAHLAWEMTSFAHGSEQADAAERAARRLFGTADGQGGAAAGEAGSDTGAAATDADLPGGEVALDILKAGIAASALFAMTPLCASKSEARRLIVQGGAQVNAAKVTDADTVVDDGWLDAQGGMLLRAGKKRMWYVRAVG